MRTISPFTIALAFCFGMFSSTLLSSAAEKPVISLVRAKVLTVGKSMPVGNVSATVEITHVYTGDMGLKGTTFTDYYNIGGFTSSNAAIVEFKVDDVGLWSLKPIGSDFVPCYDSLMPFRSRTLKSDPDDIRYDHHLTLAGEIEKIDKAKPEDRTSLLRELLTHRTPEVSAWSVRKLAVTDTDPARRVLNELADKPDIDQPIAGQIALDQVLYKSKKKNWYESKVRKALLRSWVDGKPNDFDAHSILQRISSASQGGELPEKYFAELAQAAAENNNWPRAARLDAISCVGRIAGRSPYEESTHMWLFTYVQKNEDIAFRRAAAFAMYYMTLNPVHIKAVEAHLTTEPNKEIVQTLRAAIKEAKQPKKP